MGLVEQFLTLWVGLSILAGIVLGQALPRVFRAIGAATVAGVLVEAPVMLSVVHLVRRSQGGYERNQSH
jgi:arsenite transporter